MALTIAEEQRKDVTILKLSGRLVLGGEMNDFRSTVKRLLDAGDKKIIVDLGEVSYIDSAGLGTLVSAFASVSNAGGDQLLSDSIGAVLGTAEDDGRTMRSNETSGERDPICPFGVHPMVDSRGRFLLFRIDRDVHRRLLVSPNESVDVTVEGGREEHGLPVGANLVEDPLYIG